MVKIVELKENISSGTNDKCFRCKQPVTSCYREVDKKLFHKDCFVCLDCNKELDEKMLQICGNHLHCSECYHKMFLFPCMRCNLPIEKDELVEGHGWKFHQNCFRCTTCDKPMSPDRQFLIADKIFCELQCVTKDPPMYILHEIMPQIPRNMNLITIFTDF